MVPRSRIRPAPILLFLSAALALCGCAVLDPPPPRSGGDRLSDAAKETRKEPAEQKTLQGGERVGCGDSEVEVGIGMVGREDAGRPPSPPSDLEGEPPRRRGLLEGWDLGVVVGRGALASADFAPSSLFGLRAGGEPAPRTRVDLALLGGPVRFTPGADVAALLREPMDLAADLSVRYALTPPHAAIGLAPIVGLRFGTLFWRYRNGLRIERDGELRTVSRDWIDHTSPYAGVALTLVRTPHLEIGGTALLGWRFYHAHTNEGLRNDLFGDTRFTEFQLATTIPF